MPRTAFSHRRLLVAAAAALTMISLAAGCTAEPASPVSTASIPAGGLPSPHVHGVAVNPGDGRVYLATHHGLFRYDDTGPVRVGPVIDLMGFTVAGSNRFYASGHPGEGSDLPNPVGRITSTDAGQTWTPLSRQGESDFHALTASPAGVLGNDGTLRASQDGRQWRDCRWRHQQRRWPPDPTAERLSPPLDTGLFRSIDAAHTWEEPTEAPPLKVLSWAGDGTAVGATFDGALYVSTDTGLTWQRRGQTPPPQAIAAGADPERVLVATGDEVLNDDRRQHIHTAAGWWQVGIDPWPSAFVQRRTRTPRDPAGPCLLNGHHRTAATGGARSAGLGTVRVFLCHRLRT